MQSQCAYRLNGRQQLRSSRFDGGWIETKDRI